MRLLPNSDAHTFCDQSAVGYTEYESFWPQSESYFFSGDVNTKTRSVELNSAAALQRAALHLQPCRIGGI
jgi:hypothetical protein